MDTFEEAHCTRPDYIFASISRMYDYSNVYIYLRIDSAYIQDIVGARLHVHLSISQGRLEVREGEILLFPTAFERSAAGVSQAARIVLR